MNGEVFQVESDELQGRGESADVVFGTLQCMCDLTESEE